MNYKRTSYLGELVLALRMTITVMAVFLWGGCKMCFRHNLFYSFVLVPTCTHARLA